MKDNWPLFNLTQNEWEELCAIEYVLTQGYSKNEEEDTKRLHELREKRFANFSEKEINEYFSSDNDWANSPRSWRTGKLDIYYVAAIENTTALCINADDLSFLFEHYPELDRYGRLSMATLLDHLMDRITSFRFTTANEKYIHFKQTSCCITNVSVQHEKVQCVPGKGQ